MKRMLGTLNEKDKGEATQQSANPNPRKEAESQQKPWLTDLRSFAVYICQKTLAQEFFGFTLEAQTVPKP
jgi:hypothetical protein